MGSAMTIGKKIFIYFLVVIAVTAALPGLLSPVFQILLPQEYLLILTGVLAILTGMTLAFVLIQEPDHGDSIPGCHGAHRGGG
jgi:hypothetical protein